MTTSERMRTCERMKLVARRCANPMPGAVGDLTRNYDTLEKLWRRFPENFYDKTPMPSPHQIIAICERMEREAEEDKRFAEALK